MFFGRVRTVARVGCCALHRQASSCEYFLQTVWTRDKKVVLCVTSIDVLQCLRQSPMLHSSILPNSHISYHTWHPNSPILLQPELHQALTCTVWWLLRTTITHSRRHNRRLESHNGWPPVVEADICGKLIKWQVHQGRGEGDGRTKDSGRSICGSAPSSRGVAPIICMSVRPSSVCAVTVWL